MAYTDVNWDDVKQAIAIGAGEFDYEDAFNEGYMAAWDECMKCQNMVEKVNSSALKAQGAKQGFIAGAAITGITAIGGVCYYFYRKNKKEKEETTKKNWREM